MTTDPGDLVLDPTCGSGTGAYVSEQWGRRWITIDTSRVALALARARIMGARYLYYLLADSPEGHEKEAELTHMAQSDAPSHCDIRQGFVYERVPHITLKAVANNAEIDVIWERWQETLEPLRAKLNATARAHLGRMGNPTRGGRALVRICRRGLDQTRRGNDGRREIHGASHSERRAGPRLRAGRRARRASRSVGACSDRSACPVVERAHRPTAGDRRLHCRQGGL